MDDSHLILEAARMFKETVLQLDVSSLSSRQHATRDRDACETHCQETRAALRESEAQLLDRGGAYRAFELEAWRERADPTVRSLSLSLSLSLSPFTDR